MPVRSACRRRRLLLVVRLVADVQGAARLDAELCERDPEDARVGLLGAGDRGGHDRLEQVPQPQPLDVVGQRAVPVRDHRQGDPAPAQVVESRHGTRHRLELECLDEGSDEAGRFDLVASARRVQEHGDALEAERRQPRRVEPRSERGL